MKFYFKEELLTLEEVVARKWEPSDELRIYLMNKWGSTTQISDKDILRDCWRILGGNEVVIRNITFVIGQARPATASRQKEELALIFMILEKNQVIKNVTINCDDTVFHRDFFNEWPPQVITSKNNIKLLTIHVGSRLARSVGGDRPVIKSFPRQKVLSYVVGKKARASLRDPGANANVVKKKARASSKAPNVDGKIEVGKAGASLKAPNVKDIGNKAAQEEQQNTTIDPEDDETELDPKVAVMIRERMNMDINRLTLRVQELEFESEKLKKSNSRLSRANKLVQNRHTRLQIKCEHLERKKEKLIEGNNEFLRRIQQLEENVHEAAHANHSMQSQLAELEQSNKDYKAERDELKFKLEKAEKKLGMQQT